jgi:hypothetical protein
MAYFKQQIFLGAGEESTQDVKTLKIKLNEALDIIYALQSLKEEKTSDKTYPGEWRNGVEVKLQSLAEEIYIALTGNVRAFY